MFIKTWAQEQQREAGGREALPKARSSSALRHRDSAPQSARRQGLVFPRTRGAELPRHKQNIHKACFSTCHRKGP